MLRHGCLLAHRGPDDEGVYLEPEAGLGLAHRRLAILDLSPEGHQPMISPSGRYVIVYNGEIYNHLELRERLRRELPEIAFRGGSDTETLLAVVERWGVACALKALNGMFAFALWDRQARCLYLARDRMGEKPLYVGWLGGALVCASELKPLLSAFPADTDDEAMALMLGLGYVPAPRSILQGVFKLPPGHYLRLTADDANRPASLDGFVAAARCYWNPAEHLSNPESSMHPVEQLDRLEQVLREAVRSRMLSDVPLGACLSGGVDSSLVAALMQAQSMDKIKTFTVGFKEAAYNEAPHARRIADYLGTDHTEIVLPAADALDLIPQLPRIWDEPFGDSSQLPTLLLSQALRRHVTVALSGDGGDELFYGYDRYFIARRLWPLYGWLPGRLRRFIAQQMGPLAGKSFRFWRLSQRLSAPDFDAFYLSVLSIFPNPALLLSDAPALWPQLPVLSTPINDKSVRMMLRDQTLYLPDDILVKVDRASMAVGLEIRAPLLDHRVVELANALPASLKHRDGRGKWPLRQVLSRYLPPELFERPKQGFGIPIHEWLRGPLREWADDLLAPATLSCVPQLQAATIHRIWQNHRDGKIDAGYLLWNVLMLIAWLREWRFCKF